MIASFLLITSLFTSTNGQAQMHTSLCENRSIHTETSLFTSINGQTHMHTLITNNIIRTDPNHRNPLQTQSAPRGENGQIQINEHNGQIQISERSYHNVKKQKPKILCGPP